MKLVLAVTTYNRKIFLEKLVNSFFATRTNDHSWELIIADDGSDDGTIPYLSGLKETHPVSIVLNNRTGVHHQFNTIVQLLEKMSFDFCFKCDDDIEFTRPGWDELYTKAINDSGFHHLCYFDPNWRPDKNLDPPVVRGRLVGRCRAIDAQGSFITLSPQVVQQVGYMDVANFGFRGVGHIDYTMRACRLGFNDMAHPFDAKGSNDYIRTQAAEYRPALAPELLLGMEDDEETSRKYRLLNQPRTYIPLNESPPRLDDKTEREFLVRAIRSLEKQKQWYEAEIKRLKAWEKSQYGHLPGWFIRLGKIFKLLTK